MVALVDNPTGDDLGELMGRNDIEFTQGAAQTAVNMARALASAYTRGRGFTDPTKVPASLRSLILLRAVRLLGNPQQLTSETRDGVAMSYGSAGQGFTFQETLTLNDFRKTAGAIR